MGLLRYPGSKAKKVRDIISHFPPTFSGGMFYDGTRYVEPFAGSASVCFALLRSMDRPVNAWINELDYGVYALWKTVQLNPQSLADEVRRCRPDVKLFELCKNQSLNQTRSTLVRSALEKLILHRCSFSGLGSMSGGPLGGKEQNSEYSITCRWNVGSILNQIGKHHRLMAQHNIEITCMDAIDVLSELNSRDFVYLDPPYWEQGPNLYQYSFANHDHHKLERYLRNASFEWLLSYDKTTQVEQLYQSYEKVPLQFTYTASNGNNTKTNELLIFSRRAHSHVE